MKVFISYSHGDLEFTKKIADLILSHAKPIYWNQNKVPGDSDWASIFSWIKDCSIVLAIISESVVKRGLSVGQEVGYARKANKVVIPFVSRKIARDDLGYLKGLTAIHYDDQDPSIAIAELKTAIQRQKKKIEGSEAVALLTIGAIILFLLSKSK